MSSKLQKLTTHLKKTIRHIPGQVESWVEECAIEMLIKNHGEYTQICQHRNSCVIYIERFTGDDRMLTSVLTVWLDENDAGREDEEVPPKISVEPLDSGNREQPAFDIVIEIEFIDPVFLQRDQNGAISWRGVNWSLIDTPVINIADAVQGVDRV